MRSKKGFIGDFGIYIVMLFVVALGLLAVYYVVKEVDTSFANMDNVPDRTKDYINDFKTRYVGIWDFFFLFMVVGFLIVIVIFAFAIRSHPVFAMLSILILILFGVIGVHFANSFQDVTTTSAFSTLTNEFSFIPFLMEYLPHIIILFGIIFVIILYAKTRDTSVL